ncbi:ABC transporter permease [Nocardioides campestrisoli]|uniref:ABC transporter permease n=1 Tax=Nocardioides campestrisoli TaxID=2736757 RepID=UPI0015E784E2|nr:ABC transporter permease [Nocardioides campestrisoli]
MSTTASTTRQTTALSRTLGLARFNWTLMVRNRTTMLYAFAVPIVPLALLFTVTDPDPMAGTATLGIALLMALLFPGYYNLLSMFVTRRDELVLKRLRTGETRDPELVVSMALPGLAIVLAVLVLTVPIAAVAGFDLPLNPLLLALGVLLAGVTFAALALWTAAWTKTAEAAQLTSGPVMIIALAGFMAPAVPERVAAFLEYLPGAAVNDLVRSAWFGLERGSDEATVGFWQSWVEVAPALGILLAWTAFALVLAARSMRWEPRG